MTSRQSSGSWLPSSLSRWQLNSLLGATWTSAKGHKCRGSCHSSDNFTFRGTSCKFKWVLIAKSLCVSQRADWSCCGWSGLSEVAAIQLHIYYSRAFQWYPSEPMWHVSRVQKCVLKFVNFKVQKVQKPHMIDLGTHSPWRYDALWSICSIGGLWAPLQNCFTVLDPCVKSSI